MQRQVNGLGVTQPSAAQVPRAPFLGELERRVREGDYTRADRPVSPFPGACSYLLRTQKCAQHGLKRSRNAGSEVPAGRSSTMSSR
jgi:hypothetical protein